MSKSLGTTDDDEVMILRSDRPHCVSPMGYVAAAFVFALMIPFIVSSFYTPNAVVLLIPLSIFDLYLWIRSSAFLYLHLDRDSVGWGKFGAPKPIPFASIRSVIVGPRRVTRTYLAGLLVRLVDSIPVFFVWLFRIERVYLIPADLKHIIELPSNFGMTASALSELLKQKRTAFVNEAKNV